mmetsp:Transcript_52927/g.84115  ORF Transcript_52927/g.84115 Transcript_52927/m.84115 type:complete len:498 (+) Transcript_52927:100-1593(+)|eukprot:CAMPEP_0169119124 /NCGR_PEP_ID=MMETSP1015-20121227/31376_1 /TAXON_ID=342587 /ORGANISM="Karlodinium micrum, Strain CCMP2283" /LENGTH=497 /DNA_ID=CAMNT_0009181957 /DNA_START=72 /DNA_END=1565 /DNA_ORIENTATION=+
MPRAARSLIALISCTILTNVIAREKRGLRIRRSVAPAELEHESLVAVRGSRSNVPIAKAGQPTLLTGSQRKMEIQGTSGSAQKPLSQNVSNPSVLIQRQRRATNPILVRPNAGNGVDKIMFGLIAKNFFGAILKRNRFNIDIVLSIRWTDPRVIRLIPAGLDNVTIAWSQALDLIWMPGIVVANKDIEMYEVISASITIYRSGEVMRVERAQARCMKKYLLQEYPFDEQGLEVQVVSSKYMLDEVVLVPNMNTSAVEENIWGLYDLTSWSISVYDDYNGDLRKSRGKLVMNLRRNIDKYVDDHLVPTFIVLTISWAVFYFPFGKDRNPFITPRLALSILSLLTFTNLMVKSSKELPGPAPFNWNDLFNQQIQCMLFLTIVLNICSEIFLHHFDEVGIAKMMNNEAKFLLPFASLLNIGVILSAGMYKWMSLYLATILTKTFIVLTILFYAAYIIMHWKRRQSTKAGGEELAVAAADEGEGEDADCDGGDDGGDGGCD